MEPLAKYKALVIGGTGATGRVHLQFLHKNIKNFTFRK